MFSFSYTITPTLKTEIEKINSTRDKILQQLIPRKEESKLRWEQSITRATEASRLTPKKLRRQEVWDRIDPRHQKSQDSKSEENSYIKAYEWINQHWYLNPEKISNSTVRKLFGFFPNTTRIDEKQLQDVLDFIQVKPEHPIVQAGLALILVSQILPDENNIKLSTMLSNMYMYKYGYDFRGMLNLEGFFVSDLPHFKDLLDSAQKESNLSAFLEYFTSAVSISSEHVLRQLGNPQFRNDLPAIFYDLTERQKDILVLFAKPDAKITNKTVQKEFKISQITASRDLAKLHTLGLIFSGGKGRSVYYTKI